MVSMSALGSLGRTGNLFFQISAVIGYARKHKINYILPHFGFEKDLAGRFNTSNHIPKFPIHRERQFNYYQLPYSKQIDLYGYWQSEKYWKHCEAEIRKLFSPNESLKAILQKDIKENSCSIHVRRKDYLDLPDYHFNLTLKYYNDAIEKIKSMTTIDNFVVFSDDIEWCKANFPEDFIFMENNSAIEDLFLQSFCNHNIIANSSFSWWASYLNSNPSKIVIAPNKKSWFGKAMNKNVNDLYLENWILI